MYSCQKCAYLTGSISYKSGTLVAYEGLDSANSFVLNFTYENSTINHTYRKYTNTLFSNMFIFRLA